MSNKEWKPATDPGDLAVRLRDGELFDLAGVKIWYDPTKECPFRYDNYPLLSCWGDYAEMTQWIEQPEWAKQLDNFNVWCRVSDTSEKHAASMNTARLIEKYTVGSDYHYKTKGGFSWKFAIPLENLTEPKE